MPIKVKIHDKQSQVPITICNDKSQVKASSGCDISERRLDLKINQEIKDREEADAYLQEQIDEITIQEGAKAIQVRGIRDGSIDISLLDAQGQTLSTGTLEESMLRPYLGDIAPSDIYQGKVWLDSIETQEASNSQSINSQFLQTLFNNHLQEFIVESSNESQIIIESTQSQQQEEEFVIHQASNENEYIVEN